MNKSFIRLMLCLVPGLVMSFVFAGNFTFLTDSPVSYFTKEDFDAFISAQQRALQSPDGTRISWMNPKSGAWGYFIPSGTRTEDGTQCKKLKMITNAKQRTGSSIYKFCKTPDGWKAT
jgi:surface antigen